MVDQIVSVAFDQAALKAIDNEPQLVSFIEGLGLEVANRANTNAASRLTDRGGGGIGSVESRIEHDDQGAYARIAPDPTHFYMWFAEFGTSRERPRPFLRPALYAVRGATGGKTSAIRSISRNRAAAAITKRNRLLYRARKAARKGN